MKKLKLTKILLTILSMLLMIPYQLTYANNEAEAIEVITSKVVSDDLLEATIHVAIRHDDTVTIQSIEKPNAEAEAYNQQEVTYLVNENGVYTFKVHYVKNDALDVTLTKEVTVEVNEIEDISFRNILPANIENGKGIQVSFKTPKITEEFANNNLTNAIVIDGANLVQDAAEDLTLEVSIPALLFKYPQSNLDSQHFIDNFAVVTGNVGKVIETVEDPATNTTTIRVKLNRVTRTTKIEMPFNFSFTDRITPLDLRLAPTAKVVNADNAVLSNATDVEYRVKYEERTAIKKMYGSKENGALVPAGTALAGNPNYIDPNKAEYVMFTYDYEYGTGAQPPARLDEKVVIIDRLPEYVNHEGQTVKAHFNPALNPGWTKKADGSVEYTVNLDKSTYVGDIRKIDIREQISQVTLFLSFPGAPVKEGGALKNYVNNVSMSATGINGATETPKVLTDDITFNLEAKPNSGKGMFSKHNIFDRIPYDHHSLYAEVLRFGMRAANNLTSDLTDFKIVEDATKFDSRLYFSKVVNVKEGERDVSSEYQVKAYRADGTFTIFEIGSELNLSTQAKINDYANQVNNGTLAIADVPDDAVVEYVKFEIGRKDNAPLKSGAPMIQTEVEMRFKNPFHVQGTLNSRDIRNEASLVGNYKDAADTVKSIKVDSFAAKLFIPVDEKVVLTKSTNQGNATKINDTINIFNISLDLRDLSKNRLIKDGTFIDLLPEGLSTIGTTYVMPLNNSDPYFKGYEIIKDYKGTGRDAIKINLNTFRMKDLKTTNGKTPYALDFAIRNIKINDKIIPTSAETPTNNNDNHVYFFEGNGQSFPDNIGSQQKVVDTLDINENGKTDDFVLEATSKVVAQVPSLVRSNKYIRSIEGATINDPVDETRPWTDRIMTNYDSGVSGGRFQYKLEVKNYTATPTEGLVLYDVIPNVNDKKSDGNPRNSAFRNRLVAPLRIEIDGIDVSADYDIFYTTDAPAYDAATGVPTSTWQLAVANYEDVKAIKVALKPGKSLPAFKVLNVIMDMKAPKYENTSLANTEAIGSFQVIYDGSVAYAEADMVYNALPDIRNITVRKEWINATAQKITVDLLQNDVVIATKELLETETTLVFEHLPINDPAGVPFVYRVVERPLPGFKTTYEGDIETGIVIKNEKTKPVNPNVRPNPPVVTPKKQVSIKIPKTQDNSMPYFYGMMAMLSVVLLLVMNKKTLKNHK